MDRRKFFKDSCGLCLAATGVAALSTFLVSCETAAVFNSTATDNKIIVPITELADKNVLIVKHKNSESDIALVKTKDGNWKALLMLCTHASNPLSFTGNGFKCHVHFSEFNLDGIPQSGPAQKPLKLLKTEKNDREIVIHLS